MRLCFSKLTELRDKDLDRLRVLYLHKISNFIIFFRFCFFARADKWDLLIEHKIQLLVIESVFDKKLIFFI